MRIVICASMSAVNKVVEIANNLQLIGHEVIVPENIEKHIVKTFSSHESTEEKIENDLIRGYFEKIKNCDAVLIINEDKNDVKNYIGGNTFLEMGFAHVLGKKIFLLNEIPEVSYRDEIIALQSIVLNKDLSAII